MATINYNTEKLIAGNVVSAVKTAGTGTYYRGQLLGRIDDTNVYAPYASDGTDGTENIRAIVSAGRELTAEGEISVYITGSEVAKAGVVNASGEELSVTTAMIESAQDNGIVIKE